jgi:hypothetical protein
LAQKASTSAEASAKGPTPQQLLLGQSKNDANLRTVTPMGQRLLAGPLMRAALDLSPLLDQGERFEKMRVLPVIVRDKMQDLLDMLYLGGIDLGFSQTDTLEFLKSDTPTSRSSAGRSGGVRRAHLPSGQARPGGRGAQGGRVARIARPVRRRFF